MAFSMPTDKKEPMWKLGFKNGLFECLDGGTALCTLQFFTLVRAGPLTIGLFSPVRRLGDMLLPMPYCWWCCIYCKY